MYDNLTLVVLRTPLFCSSASLSRVWSSSAGKPPPTESASVVSPLAMVVVEIVLRVMPDGFDTMPLIFDPFARFVTELQSTSVISTQRKLIIKLTWQVPNLLFF
jgi:hypothetical protein